MPQEKITTSTPHQRIMPRPPIRNSSNLNSNSCSEILLDNCSEKKRKTKTKNKEHSSNLSDSNSYSEESGNTDDGISDDDNSDDGVDLTPPSIKDDHDDKAKCGFLRWTTLCIVVTVIPAVLYACMMPNSSAEKPAEVQTLARIRNDFKSQSEELWASFEAGLNDVVTMNKPSIFIFLYKEEAEDTLNLLLKKLAQLAACNITSCSQKPLELTSSTLNSPDILEDYGNILETYQRDLEEKGVLIIKSLDKVSGVSAQALHSICDEITPFVPKLLIMFTIKVKEEPLSSKESFRLVEELLRGPWKNEMKPEVFNALITRITNMIVQVNP